MVIAYDSDFYILFPASGDTYREEYIVVRGNKSIFRGAVFLQFRDQKIAADGVSR